MTSSSTSSPCRGGVGRATIQAVEIKRALEPLEEAAAKERLAEGQHKGAKLGGRGKKKTSEPNGLRGKRAPQARDKVAKATGKDALLVFSHTFLALGGSDLAPVHQVGGSLTGDNFWW